MGRWTAATIHESGDLPGASASTPSWKEEAAVKRRLLILTLALLLPTVSSAQGTADPTPEVKTAAVDVKQTDPVVVTATKVETPQSQLGAAVSIVTDDDVKTYHYTD